MGARRTVLLGLLCIAAVCLSSVGKLAPASALRILVDNGVRFTTSGSRVDVHSGTILRAQDGLFYWYGETYACGFRWTDPTTPYCGAQVYRSSDLTRWQGPWSLFDASTQLWQNLCMHEAGLAGNGCFRPKVVYNAATRLYVLWLNTPGFSGNGYRVLTSRRPTGPFVLAAKPDLEDENIPDWRGDHHTQDGDEGLFVDANGTGWLVWNRGGRLLQEKLNSSYTSGDGTPAVIMNYPQRQPWAGVESPSEFMHDGWYYIAMSLPRCPYCVATGTAIEQAASPGGPWTYQGTVTDDSCAGQPNEVDEISPGVLLWTSDRWVRGGPAGMWPRLNETQATQAWETLKFNGLEVAPITCTAKFPLSFR
ncbi:MAG TPA: family 43 glycosylhydrolase [Candidatus Dormibacteraeota bacterium]|nr:family 43 glycosylhydrolase [Candidatus Dormibacteraeota bacterium]